MPHRVSKQPNVRQCILDLLADGVARTTDEIAAAMHERHGYARQTATVELSKMAYLCNLERTRPEPMRRLFTYRRTDVTEKAAPA